MHDDQDSLQSGLEAWERKEYEKAFALLLPIAGQGHPEAQCIVGDMYWLGWGTEMNLQEAVKYFQLSAEQGHANACNTLGCLYTAGGPGLDRDAEEAKKWYRRAVESGFDMYDEEWVANLYR